MMDWSLANNMISPSEFQIQLSFFEYLKNYSTLNNSTFAIPNGGSRHIVEAVNLVKSGVKKGIPDVMVAIPSSPWHGLFIEFKSAKGKMSEHQQEMIEILSSHGYYCRVCYSLEEAIRALHEYFGENDLGSVRK